jgi:hypothetical protein
MQLISLVQLNSFNIINMLLSVSKLSSYANNVLVLRKHVKKLH